jgi:hypothetical protein
MLSEKEYLLACLSEECSEVIKVCNKILRFGMDTQHPKDSKTTNKTHLVYELNDLMSIVEMIVDRKIIPTKWEDYKKRMEKSEKVLHYMNERETAESKT